MLYLFVDEDDWKSSDYSLSPMVVMLDRNLRELGMLLAADHQIDLLNIFVSDACYDDVRFEPIWNVLAGSTMPLTSLNDPYHPTTFTTSNGYTFFNEVWGGGFAST